MSSPYREGKPLADVIPPDRRRQRAILMIVGGMIAGAVVIEALRGAFSPEARAPVPPPLVRPPDPNALPGALTRDEITVVVAAHRAALRETCFGSKPTPASAQVTIDLVVGVNGDVESTSTQGSDPVVTHCVESEVRRWRFPAHIEPSMSTRIPFLFDRT